MIDLLDLKFQGSNVVRIEFCNKLYNKLFTNFHVDVGTFTLSPLFDNVTSSKKEFSFHKNYAIDKGSLP